VLCQRIAKVWSAFVARRRLCRGLKRKVRTALRGALAVPLSRVHEMRAHNKREGVLIAFATECLASGMPGSHEMHNRFGSTAAPPPKKLFEYIRCAEQLRLLRRKRERWHSKAQESDAERRDEIQRAAALATAAAARHEVVHQRRSAAERVASAAAREEQKHDESVRLAHRAHRKPAPGAACSRHILSTPPPPRRPTRCAWRRARTLRASARRRGARPSR
jgi:hypothetical protein